ncbi:perlwapin-like [Haliotis asinina]|uniref:perlwapin-like n=1 Tax=Haliotis asinina TaxID=109174 RepID=UPI003531DAC6
MVTWYNFALGLVCHLAMMIKGDRGCAQICPTGTRCIRAPVTCIEGNCTNKFICEPEDTDREASSIERRSVGTCPTVLPGRSGPCVEQCRRDEDCTRGRKCCYNGCGHTCRRMDRRRKYSHHTKPGSCPWYARESLNCDVQCLHDYGCPGRTKCCQTTCGQICSEPCFQWLSTQSTRIRTWQTPRRCARPSS